MELDALFDPKFDILYPQIVPEGDDFVRVTWLNGKHVVRIPLVMNGKVAYLIGVIVGDGYLSKAARRKSHGRGFYWKIAITGPYGYLLNIRNLFVEVFGLRGGLVKDRRKKRTWQLRFGSLILHRFFARVIGIPQGRKTTHPSWSRLELVKPYPLHFLAGLIRSDGYVGTRYVGIIQKRFRFLIRVKRFAKETLGLSFRGPYVNRKLQGKVAGWMISIYDKEERTKLISDIRALGFGAGKSGK